MEFKRLRREDLCSNLFLDLLLCGDLSFDLPRMIAEFGLLALSLLGDAVASSLFSGTWALAMAFMELFILPGVVCVKSLSILRFVIF